MMRHNIVLSSRVRLARNYEDIPFDLSQRPELAAICISRTANALKAAGVDKGFDMIQTDWTLPLRQYLDGR